MNRVIYKGDCSCGSPYIGVTKCKAEVRLTEHNDPTKSSEPSKQHQPLFYKDNYFQYSKNC